MCCLQTRCSAKESGYSLEFNGPLQTREHSLLVIRRKKGLWTDSAVSWNFTPFCCTITFMHMRYTEKAQSYSLEFCPGGLYESKPQACLLAQFFPLAGVVYCLSLVCLVCFVFVSFHSQSPTAQELLMNVQWFRMFCKGVESLEDEEHTTGHWKLMTIESHY